MELSQKELKELLSYDAETGKFSWVQPKGSKAEGSPAGYVSWNGYVEIKINKRVYWAHRLAWLYVHGNFPKEHTDHIDGDRANNSISNLREASNAQNMQNIRNPTIKNTSGFLGVQKSGKKWKAMISVSGIKKHIGTFSSKEEAYEAYVRAKRINHEYCTL